MRGKIANLGGKMPRENDDACAVAAALNPHPEGRALSAFTRVFDALWRGVSKEKGQIAA
jgi:hypothetical protein